MDLESVVVTGANRGIGLELVRQLVHLPNPPKYVFATYRSEDTTQELKKIRDGSQKSEVILIKMDVAFCQEVTEARKVIEEKLGDNGLTLLINNAGVCTHHSFPELTGGNLLSHYLPNTVGPILVFQELYPLLQKAADRKEGATSSPMGVSRAAVVNITAGLGSVTTAGSDTLKMHSVVSYRMSKAALNIGMRVLASQLEGKGILIVLMCPGWVKTDMGSQFAELEVIDSVSAMIKTMSQLNEEHQGAFMDREGKSIPF